MLTLCLQDSTLQLLFEATLHKLMFDEEHASVCVEPLPESKWHNVGPSPRQ